ncbi:Conserved_hypothetical protein [Hexamita inflata]|uniref:Uncharacterized protein n=1 Tax=Hexamita inflata TaxID=28002 RepID=A0ABP1HMU0_9EUKA
MSEQLNSSYMINTQITEEMNTFHCRETEILQFHVSEYFIALSFSHKVKIYDVVKRTKFIEFDFEENVLHSYISDQKLFVITDAGTMFEIQLQINKFGRQQVNCYDLIQSCANKRLTMATCESTRVLSRKQKSNIKISSLLCSLQPDIFFFYALVKEPVQKSLIFYFNPSLPENLNYVIFKQQPTCIFKYSASLFFLGTTLGQIFSFNTLSQQQIPLLPNPSEQPVIQLSASNAKLTACLRSGKLIEHDLVNKTQKQKKINEPDQEALDASTLLNQIARSENNELTAEQQQQLQNNELQVQMNRPNAINSGQFIGEFLLFQQGKYFQVKSLKDQRMKEFDVTTLINYKDTKFRSYQTHIFEGRVYCLYNGYMIQIPVNLQNNGENIKQLDISKQIEQLEQDIVTKPKMIPETLQQSENKQNVLAITSQDIAPAKSLIQPAQIIKQFLLPSPESAITFDEIAESIIHPTVTQPTKYKPRSPNGQKSTVFPQENRFKSLLSFNQMKELSRIQPQISVYDSKEIIQIKQLGQEKVQAPESLLRVSIDSTAEQNQVITIELNQDERPPIPKRNPLIQVTALQLSELQSFGQKITARSVLNSSYIVDTSNYAPLRIIQNAEFITSSSESEMEQEIDVRPYSPPRLNIKKKPNINNALQVTFKPLNAKQQQEALEAVTQEPRTLSGHLLRVPKDSLELSQLPSPRGRLSKVDVDCYASSIIDLQEKASKTTLDSIQEELKQLNENVRYQRKIKKADDEIDLKQFKKSNSFHNSKKIDTVKRKMHKKNSLSNKNENNVTLKNAQMVYEQKQIIEQMIKNGNTEQAEQAEEQLKHVIKDLELDKLDSDNKSPEHELEENIIQIDLDESGRNSHQSTIRRVSGASVKNILKVSESESYYSDDSSNYESESVSQSKDTENESVSKDQSISPDESIDSAELEKQESFQYINKSASQLNLGDMQSFQQHEKSQSPSQFKKSTDKGKNKITKVTKKEKTAKVVKDIEKSEKSESKVLKKAKAEKILEKPSDKPVEKLKKKSKKSKADENDQSPISNIEGQETEQEDMLKEGSNKLYKEKKSKKRKVSIQESDHQESVQESDLEDKKEKKKKKKKNLEDINENQEQDQEFQNLSPTKKVKTKKTKDSASKKPQKDSLEADSENRRSSSQKSNFNIKSSGKRESQMREGSESGYNSNSAAKKKDLKKNKADAVNEDVTKLIPDKSFTVQQLHFLMSYFNQNDSFSNQLGLIDEILKRIKPQTDPDILSSFTYKDMKIEPETVFKLFPFFKYSKTDQFLETVNDITGFKKVSKTFQKQFIKEMQNINDKLIETTNEYLPPKVILEEGDWSMFAEKEAEYAALQIIAAREKQFSDRDKMFLKYVPMRNFFYSYQLNKTPMKKMPKCEPMRSKSADNRVSNDALNYEYNVERYVDRSAFNNFYKKMEEIFEIETVAKKEKKNVKPSDLQKICTNIVNNKLNTLEYLKNQGKLKNYIQQTEEEYLEQYQSKFNVRNATVMRSVSAFSYRKVNYKDSELPELISNQQYKNSEKEQKMLEFNKYLQRINIFGDATVKNISKDDFNAQRAVNIAPIQRLTRKPCKSRSLKLHQIQRNQFSYFKPSWQIDPFRQHKKAFKELQIAPLNRGVDQCISDSEITYTVLKYDRFPEYTKYEKATSAHLYMQKFDVNQLYQKSEKEVQMSLDQALNEFYNIKPMTDAQLSILEQKMDVVGSVARKPDEYNTESESATPAPPVPTAEPQKIEVIGSILTKNPAQAAYRHQLDEFCAGNGFDIDVLTYEKHKVDQSLAQLNPEYAQQLLRVPQPLIRPPPNLEFKVLTKEFLSCKYDEEKQERKEEQKMLRYIMKEEQKAQEKDVKVLKVSKIYEAKKKMMQMKLKEQQLKQLTKHSKQIPLDVIELFLLKQTQDTVIKWDQIYVIDNRLMLQVSRNNQFFKILSVSTPIGQIDNIEFMKSVTYVSNHVVNEFEAIDYYAKQMKILEMQQKCQKMREYTNAFEDEMFPSYLAASRMNIYYTYNNSLKELFQIAEDENRAVEILEERERLRIENERRMEEARKQEEIERERQRIEQLRLEAIARLTELVNQFLTRDGFNTAGIRIFQIIRGVDLEFQPIQFQSLLSSFDFDYSMRVHYRICQFEFSLQLLRAQLSTFKHLYKLVTDETVQFMSQTKMVDFKFIARPSFKGESNCGVAAFAKGFVSHRDFHAREMVDTVNLTKLDIQYKHGESQQPQFQVNTELSPVREALRDQKTRLLQINNYEKPRLKAELVEARPSSDLVRAIQRNDVQKLLQITQRHQSELGQILNGSEAGTENSEIHSFGEPSEHTSQHKMTAIPLLETKKQPKFIPKPKPLPMQISDSILKIPKSAVKKTRPPSQLANSFKPKEEESELRLSAELRTSGPKETKIQKSKAEELFEEQKNRNDVQLKVYVEKRAPKK